MKPVGIVRDESWQRWGWIVESVAKRHGVSVGGLLGRERTSYMARARHDLMSCLWGSGLAFAEVGRLLGLNHTSVMYGVRQSL